MSAYSPDTDAERFARIAQEFRRVAAQIAQSGDDAAERLERYADAIDGEISRAVRRPA